MTTRRRTTGVTFTQFMDVRQTLRSRGFRDIKAVNEVPEQGIEFGSLWVRDADGARFWLNFRTISHLPD